MHSPIYGSDLYPNNVPAKSAWQRMMRRAAVEPAIGHLKQEHRLNRNRLRGMLQDKLSAILSAAGMNFRKLAEVPGNFCAYFTVGFSLHLQARFIAVFENSGLSKSTNLHFHFI